MKEGLFIGRLAKELGLNPRTIRYYEALGLLPEPGRTPSGYRHYPPEVADRLRFVKKAQRLGFKLNEIKDILLLKDRGTEPCPHVRELATRKIKELEEVIRESKSLQKNLKGLLKICPSRRHKGPAICPHIEESSSLYEKRRRIKK
jgi:DNA-binding transcriptional MerR regulator